MKRVISSLLATSVLIFSSVTLGAEDLATKVRKSVALLYTQSEDGSFRMHCTVTAYQKVQDGYLFVTAAHCVGDDRVGEKLSADPSDESFYITFDLKGEKLFYEAKTRLVGYQHVGDDFAVFEVDTKDKFSTVEIGDETTLHDGAEIINVAGPLGLGLQTFRGTISSLYIDRPVIDPRQGINWKGAMFLQIQSGPGSSGSALVSVEQGKIVGLLVGTVGQGNTVGIPISRFIDATNKADKNEYKYYHIDGK